MRYLGISIFVLAFVPLIFGGTIYRMLEKVMSLKLIFILGWLVFVTVFLVPPRIMWEVATGFVGFGSYAQRAETIIVDPHFHFTMVDNADRLLVKGTVEPNKPDPVIGQYQIEGKEQPAVDKMSPAQKERLDSIVAKAKAKMRPGEFFVETQPGPGRTRRSWRSRAGSKAASGTAEKFAITDADGTRTLRRSGGRAAEIRAAAGGALEESRDGKAEPG